MGSVSHTPLRGQPQGCAGYTHQPGPALHHLIQHKRRKQKKDAVHRKNVAKRRLIQQQRSGDERLDRVCSLKGGVIEKHRSADACAEQNDMHQVHVARSPKDSRLQCMLSVFVAYSQVDPRGHQPGEKHKSVRSRGVAEGVGREPLQRVLRQMRKGHEDEEIAPQAVHSPVP